MHCRFCDLTYCPEMICGMRDHTDRHSDLKLRPRTFVSQAYQRILVHLPNAAAEGAPFGIVNSFDEPTIFPGDVFGSAVDEFAYAVEIKFRMLGLGSDRRSVKFTGCRFG